MTHLYPAALTTRVPVFRLSANVVRSCRQASQINWICFITKTSNLVYVADSLIFKAQYHHFLSAVVTVVDRAVSVAVHTWVLEHLPCHCHLMSASSPAVFAAAWRPAFWGVHFMVSFWTLSLGLVLSRITFLPLHFYSVSQKNPPCGFLKFFPKRLRIFNQYFTHLLRDHFYTRVQIFIQIFPTLTKLCHTKRDHPSIFYISLALNF